MDDLIEEVNREIERFGEVVSEQLDIVPAKVFDPGRVEARRGSPGFIRNLRRGYVSSAQAARTCIYGHLEERNAPRLSTSSLRRRLRLTLDDRVRPPHHPADNPVVSVQRA